MNKSPLLQMKLQKLYEHAQMRRSISNTILITLKNRQQYAAIKPIIKICSVAINLASPY